MVSARNKSERRVFIIGAGVSASCGFAVAQTLLREALTRLANHDAVSEAKVHDLLGYLYPGFNVALRNYPNVEDFLNLIQMACEFNSEAYMTSTLWPRQKLQETQKTVLKAVTDYFWERMRECSLDALRTFVRNCVEGGDTIITFNWDLTIEKVLEEQDKVDFWYEPTGDVVLLKPHGSIDWFRSKDLPNDMPKQSVRNIDDEIAVYPEFTLAKHQKMKRPAPVIVPPVYQKDFALPFLQNTWKRTYRAVSAADKLWIIGYSLPKEDQFARFVLARAIRNNRLRSGRGKKRDLEMKIVNPDESVQTTFSRLIGSGGPGIQFYHTSFEQFVDSVAEKAIPFP
jgi:hypothetical protein